MQTIMYLAMLAVAVGDKPLLPHNGFCQRLTSEVGGKPAKLPDHNKPWTADTIGLGAKLFRGATTSIRVKYVGEMNPDDYEQFQDVCTVVPSGATCKLRSPMALIVQTSQKRSEVKTLPNEKAIVELVRSQIRCTDK